MPTYAHYSVMEIDVEAKVVWIYAGLNWSLLGWFDHIVHAMKRCKLVGLAVISSSKPDNAKSVVLGSTRQATTCVMGYTLTLDYVEWRLERGNFVQQTDGFNYGPIACLKILELFSLVATQDVRLAYSTNSIRRMVVEQWQLYLSPCNRDLLVKVCGCLLLLEPHPIEGDVVMSLQGICKSIPW
jgi:hypothetical protein